MRRAIPTVALILLQFCVAPAAQTQVPDLSELRVRVGTYARRFITQFSNVVSDEEYDQRFAVGSRKRHLKSDFLLVAYPGRPELVMQCRCQPSAESLPR